MAWVRALGVDERLTVIAALPDSGLSIGDKLVEIRGFDSRHANEMLHRLYGSRDRGKPFDVKTHDERVVRITPFEVCRGYVQFAPPNTPARQDYHWLTLTHPLELVKAELTPDEALWLVLWSQGLSEEGGVRMRTYDFGKRAVMTVVSLAMAVSTAGAGAAADPGAMATGTAEYVAKEIGRQLQQGASARLSQELGKSMQKVADNRGALRGMSRVGATAFDEADAWAYERLKRLNVSPLAAFTLHQKLLERNLLRNALVLDQERLDGLRELARRDGLETP